MKKAIIILLIIGLLVPLAASADAVPESFYVGTWVLTQRLAQDNGVNITLLHLTEDHKAYFIIQSLYDDESSGIGRTAVKTWSASGNRIHVVIGNNTSMDLEVDGDRLHDRSTLQDYYERVGSSSAADAGSGKKGTTVGPGRYIIGKDIPPREYRFEQADEKKSVDVYVFSDVNDEIPDYFFIISKNTPYYAGLDLTEGQVLRIEAGPVFMTSPVSLDFDW